MAYVGNDPFQNKSVDTAQLADNAVTGEKIVDDITFDDITTTGNVSGSVSSTGSYGRVEATKVEGTLATAAQTNVTSVGTVTTGVWNSSFGTTSGTQISGSITATSSSIATRFDSRETDMTLATASIVSNESNMTLATASIAAITASISTTKTDISTNSANMTLATASIAAITASVSSLKTTSFAGTAGTETVFSGSVASTGSFGRVEAAGDVELKAGNLIIGTHGKGIDFSATSDASGTGVSMGSELLDDYEEGTWTPKFGGTTSNPTQNYANQQGRYTRTGNIVVCTGEVKLATSGISAGSGEPEIEQLPFTAKSGLTEYYGACAISGVKDWSTSNAGAPDRGTVEGNTTAVRLRIVNAGQAGHTDASAADYTNSTRILGFLVVYEVD